MANSEGALVEVVVASTYGFASRPQPRLVRDKDGWRRPTIYPPESSMRAGAFRVAIDGRTVGMVPSQGRFSCKVSPGRHTIRVGFMWFLSAPVDFDEPGGSTVAFTTTVRDTFTMKGFWRLAIHPFRSLVLDRTDR